MRIAMPVKDGKLNKHFGHSKQFAILDTDDSKTRVTERRDVTTPPHEPGVIPAWLAEQGVQVVLAGGMGERSRNLLAEKGIDVKLGVESHSPEELAAALMAGTLRTGVNQCDHD
ncbi:MAG: ATP-binding protein involved in chromosome partitioning [Candidatus Sumerlaeota bacterium]|nr:ATP-binding protein involved in chromosome partitioning [Candidatus Sumerlaeota bacterium]